MNILSTKQKQPCIDQSQRLQSYSRPSKHNYIYIQMKNYIYVRENIIIYWVGHNIIISVYGNCCTAHDNLHIHSEIGKDNDVILTVLLNILPDKNISC
jgi:hypothetical protein